MSPFGLICRQTVKKRRKPRKPLQGRKLRRAKGTRFELATPCDARQLSLCWGVASCVHSALSRTRVATCATPYILPLPGVSSTVRAFAYILATTPGGLYYLFTHLGRIENCNRSVSVARGDGGFASRGRDRKLIRLDAQHQD